MTDANKKKIKFIYESQVKGRNQFETRKIKFLNKREWRANKIRDLYRIS